MLPPFFFSHWYIVTMWTDSGKKILPENHMTEKKVTTDFKLSLFHKQLTITQLQVPGKWEIHAAKEKLMAVIIYISCFCYSQDHHLHKLPDVWAHCPLSISASPSFMGALLSLFWLAWVPTQTLGSWQDLGVTAHYQKKNEQKWEWSSNCFLSKHDRDLQHNYRAQVSREGSCVPQ